MTSRRASLSRAPGGIQSAIALGLSMIIAALALNVSQPPPPAIAEFSPQAVESVETAEEQAGRFGAGSVEAAAGQEGSLGPGGLPSDVEPPEELDPEIVKSRQKRCVLRPPPARQTEDPMSPPCIDYFDGDNGGATTRGVTANEIRVAIIEAEFPRAMVQPFQAYFNNRFQLYGRKITFEYLSGPATSDATRERAAANEAAQRNVFAAIASGSVAMNTFYRDLSAKEIVGMAYYPYFTSTELASMRPYTWQFRVPPDIDSANYGLWACNRLGGGRKAIHASGVGADGQPIAEQPRKLAVYYSRPLPNDHYGPNDLVKALASCGIAVEPGLVFKRNASEAYAFNPGDPVNVQDAQKMKAAGVTTVLCFCHPLNQNALMGAANGQAWSPEWPAHGTFGGQSCNHCNRAFLGSAPNQRRQLFGVVTDYKLVPVADDAWCVALREQGGTCPGAGSAHDDRQFRRALYGMMLLLASGIQMAGPELTPQSFEHGLRSATFPNPPYYTNPPRVGFTSGYSMLNGDILEFYWRDGATDPEDGSPGSNCYVKPGRFYQRREIPRHDPRDFFPPDDGNGSQCDTGANPRRS